MLQRSSFAAFRSGQSWCRRAFGERFFCGESDYGDNFEAVFGILVIEKRWRVFVRNADCDSVPGLPPTARRKFKSSFTEIFLKSLEESARFARLAKYPCGRDERCVKKLYRLWLYRLWIYGLWIVFKLVGKKVMAPEKREEKFI